MGRGRLDQLRELAGAVRRMVGAGQPSEMLAIQRAVLQRGRLGTMIDVGAHKGESCSKFAELGWNVLAFEPDENNRAILESRVGGLSNVTIDARAVGEETGRKVPFYRSRLSTGISTLSPFHETHVEAGHVTLVRLEDALEESQVGNDIDFLKIDAEGHDLFVLKTFPWGVSQPDVVLCEFENAKTVALGYAFEELCEFLIDRGYFVLVSEWFPIERYGGRHRWRGSSFYPCSLRDQSGWGNLIASRDRALLESVETSLRDRTAQ